MSRHKRIGGFVPSNSLSSSKNSSIMKLGSPSTNSSHGHSHSTRYSESRYKKHKPNIDMKSIEASDIDATERNSQIVENINKTNNVDNVGEKVVGIIGTKGLKSSNAVSVSYTALGKLCVINNRSEKLLVDGQIMIRATLLRNSPNQTTNILLKFFKNGKEIEDLSLSLNEDLLRLYYDQKGDGIGMILHNEKVLNLSHMIENVRSNYICWISSTSITGTYKLSDIIKLYIKEFKIGNRDQSLCDGIKPLNKLLLTKALQDHCRNQQSTFSVQSSCENTQQFSGGEIIKHLKAKKLLSLSNPKLKKQTSHSGNIISVPTPSTQSNDLSNPSENSPSIPKGEFYGASRIEGEGVLSKYSFDSNLRRSTRSSSISANKSQQLILSDDPEKEDVVEVFSPTLFYEFPDEYRISVSNQDFKCLYNHDWINDTILDFFLKYYVEKAIEENVIARSDVYILSSFFYTKLVSNKENYYENVHKWVMNADLFSKKYVVLPINMNFHWFGCIILNLNIMKEALSLRANKQNNTNIESFENMSDSIQPEKRESYDTPFMSDDKSKGGNRKKRDNENMELPTIYLAVYDSLRQTHTKTMDAVKEFIICYAKDVYNFDVERHQIKVRTCLVPQQPNMSDCGVHVILNTKKFFERPKETIDMWFAKYSHFQSKQINLFFEKKDRFKARSNLRDVLLELQQTQIRNKGNDVESGKDEFQDENHSDIEIIENFEEPKKTPIEQQSQIEGEEQICNTDKSSPKEYKNDSNGCSIQEIEQKNESSNGPGVLVSQLTTQNFDKKDCEQSCKKNVGTIDDCSSLSSSPFKPNKNHNALNHAKISTKQEEGKEILLVSKFWSKHSGTSDKNNVDHSHEYVSRTSRVLEASPSCRLPTEDLSDVDEEFQHMPNSKSLDSSPRELNSSEKLSPISNSTLRRKFRKLSTSQRPLENFGKPSTEKDIDHKLVGYSPNTNKAHQSEVFTDDDLSEVDLKYGENITEIIKKKLENELRNDHTSSPTRIYPLEKRESSNILNNERISLNSSPTRHSKPLDDEIHTSPTGLSSEITPRQREHRRSIKHLFKNRKYNPYSTSKLSSRGNIFDNLINKEK